MEQVFQTTDPDLAGELFRQQYTAIRMRIQGDQLLLRLANTQIGRVRLDRTVFRMELDGSGEPLERVVIARIRSGTARYSHGSSETTYGPGETYFPIPTGRDWATSVRQTDSDVVLLHPLLLDQATGLQPDTREPLRLLSDRPLSGPAVAHLWRTVDDMRALIATLPEDEPDPLLASAAARMLAASGLAAVPSTAVPGPAIEDRRDAHPATLRRALSFIDEHAHTSITIGDIAAAAFVTPRAVQIAFRRHLGTTPMDYLRRVRLDYAHRDLLTANPACDTVTAIAHRWGFTSTSWFGAYYRKAYGFPPSRTLQYD